MAILQLIRDFFHIIPGPRGQVNKAKIKENRACRGPIMRNEINSGARDEYKRVGPPRKCPCPPLFDDNDHNRGGI
jgi:hypothetical protein